MSPTTFRIDATATGATIEVDGTRLEDRVSAYSVTQRVDEPTTLTLECVAAGTIEGDGIVQVMNPAAELADVAAAVRALNPAEIRGEALQGADLGSDITAAILRVVAARIEAG